MVASATQLWGPTALPLTPARIPIGPTHPVSISLHQLPFYRITPLPSPTINKKLKQTLLSWECFAFLWLLCERSLRAVNGVALHKDVWDSPLSLSGGLVLKHTDKTKGDKLYKRYIIWLLTDISKTTEHRCLCVAASFSDNSSTCLSMLSSHDNWSSLQMPTHSSMIPMAHNSTSGTSSRFVLFSFAYFSDSSQKW